MKILPYKIIFTGKKIFKKTSFLFWTFLNFLAHVSHICFFVKLKFIFSSRDGTWPEEISSLTNDRRIAGTSPLNSAVQNVPGITGLNNLGNTCYMNAALQCVSNTKILAQYFQKNCHLHELNRDNPLGFHGHVAKRFG